MREFTQNMQLNCINTNAQNKNKALSTSTTFISQVVPRLRQLFKETYTNSVNEIVRELEKYTSVEHIRGFLFFFCEKADVEADERFDQLVVNCEGRLPSLYG